jgi:hypothetical protein
MTEQKPDNRQILQTLTELHEELERTQALDENERVLVKHLMADIQEHLRHLDQGSSAGYQPSQSSLDRFRKAINIFELSHPALTQMIEKALEALDVAGI